MSQLADGLQGKAELPARPVLITADDGFADFADNAIPALAERKLPSTLYVTTGALAGRRQESVLPPADMLRAVDLPGLAAAGLEIGAHYTHRQMDLLSENQIADEFLHSLTCCSLWGLCHTHHLWYEPMEYWAQHAVSPLDGRVGWTVVDDRYDEHVRAGEYLREIRDGDGRSVGTPRTYAGRLALYVTWAATADVDETAVSAGRLAAFARWLERSPSRKHRPGANRRRAVAPSVVPLAPARSPPTVDGILGGRTARRGR